MSRIAKKGITVPAGVDVTIATGEVKIKGPLGEIVLPVRPQIEFKVEDGSIFLTPKSGDRLMRSLVGTYAARLRAMVEGVKTPFKKVLFLEGVGYRAEVQGKKLVMALGFSHPVIVEIPEGLKVVSEKGQVIITGIDPVLVGQFAASTRALKKPEPYKGKGFRYEGEVIRRKQGKKSV
jgi:large subunit ribosomal protein L6